MQETMKSTNFENTSANAVAQLSLVEAAPDAFVDVTQAPYFADATGKKDCTDLINRAYSDIMQSGADAMQETIDLVNAGKVIEGSREAIPGRILCPHIPPKTKILYFPEGTYLVSDTLVYDQEALHTSHRDELNRCIHWLGAGADKVTIRLKDHCEGFESGEERPVIQFMPGRKSAVAMQNTFEGICVEVGAGNPGAVGISFFSNNTGAVRNALIRSLDLNGAGYAGVAVLDWNCSCALFKDITVEGFEYGLLIRHPRLYCVAEYITLRHQRSAGVWVSDHNVALRGLRSENSVPGLKVTGKEAVVQLTDSVFMGCGDDALSAIEAFDGQLHLRDVKCSRYEFSLVLQHLGERLKGNISSYTSTQVLRLFKQVSAQPLRLPVEETPRIPWNQDSENWVSVSEFGAIADGVTDATEAIQKAFNSGKPNICFPPGRYLIDDTLTIPASVRHINGLYMDLVSGPRLRAGEIEACFEVSEDSADQLCIEAIFAWVGLMGPFRLIKHAATRDLVLLDIHTQEVPLYFNTVPGSKVYLENVACTSESAPDLNGFTFVGQQVWARQLNPERAPHQVELSNSRFWLLGFKTENPSVAFHVSDDSEADIIGGIFNQYRDLNDSSTPPLVYVDNSSLSISASTTDFRKTSMGFDIITEVQGAVRKDIATEMLPHREPHLVTIPLFVARKGGKRES